MMAVERAGTEPGGFIAVDPDRSPVKVDQRLRGFERRQKDKGEREAARREDKVKKIKSSMPFPSTFNLFPLTFAP
jgi:hypothetical protein